MASLSEWRHAACNPRIPVRILQHSPLARLAGLAILWLLGDATSTAHAAAPITAAAFTPNGKQVLLGSQAGIEVRSWPELGVLENILTDLEHVHDLRFSPDGKTLLVAGGSPGQEGLVHVLRWPDRGFIRQVAQHEDLVMRVAWSPGGDAWATAGADGICHVIAVDSGQPRVRYDGHSRRVLSVAYLPDGKKLVSAGADQTLQVWDGTTGKQLRTLDNHVGSVNAVTVWPGTAGELLPTIATASEDRTVRLWQPTVGRLMRFARLASTPRAVAWTTQRDRLVVGCNDGRIRVLDGETAELLADSAGLDGWIHELIVDSSSQRLLIAGQSGCRSMPLEVARTEVDSKASNDDERRP